LVDDPFEGGAVTTDYCICDGLDIADGCSALDGVAMG